MDRFLHPDRTAADAPFEVPPAFLELAYPLPRDARSRDDYERRRHRDLPALSDEDLAFEAYRVLLRMCFERHPLALDWLRERRLAVRGEVTRRRTGAGGRRGRLAATDRSCPDRGRMGPARHPTAIRPALTPTRDGQEVRP